MIKKLKLYIKKKYIYIFFYLKDLFRNKKQMENFKWS